METKEETANVAVERPTVAFRIGEPIIPIHNISRGLLLDIAKATIGLVPKKDDDQEPLRENRAITKIGFLCAEITNHPDRRKNIIGTSFSMIDISDDSVTLLVNSSLMRPLSDCLVRSPNRAVAKLGYDCLRQSGRLDNRSQIEYKATCQT